MVAMLGAIMPLPLPMAPTVQVLPPSSNWMAYYVTAKDHTYEIGYLIGEEGCLNKGIGKIIIQLLEAKLIGIGAKEMVADPCEKNVISVKTLLGNGFKKKSDGDYRKIIS